MQKAQFDLHDTVERSHWWFVARRAIVRSIVEEVLPSRSGKKIVDVGCGTGGNLADLANDYQCLGIDTSEDAIRLARQRFPQIPFICGRAPADLEGAAATADLFLLMDVLEHVPDDFLMFSELLAAARSGAQFLITVPADMALWSPHDEAFGHYRRYDRQRLSAIWKGLPVRVRLLSHFNSRLYPIVRAIRQRNRQKHSTAGAAGTDFKLPSRSINWLLRAIFQAEQKRLLGVLHGREGYRRGVSLLALVQRQVGKIEPRAIPAELAERDVQMPASPTAPQQASAAARDDALLPVGSQSPGVESFAHP